MAYGVAVIYFATRNDPVTYYARYRAVTPASGWR